MTKQLIMVVVASVVCLSSCGRGKQATAPASQVTAETPVAELKDRDFEIMEYVLRRWPDLGTNRVYYLTTTPMRQWGGTGNWQDLPDSFHKKIADLPVTYHKASEALLSNHWVVDRKTGSGGWMLWVTVKKWISDTEVEVETGVWSAPLGGGANTAIYEKVGDDWRIKKLGESWVS